MTEVLVGVTDLAAGAGVAEYRTRDRGSGKLEQYLVCTDERVPSAKVMVGGFRTLGSGASPQVYFTLENQSGSGIIVAVRRMIVQKDPVDTANSVQTGVIYDARFSNTMPTGGTALSKMLFDTNDTSSASVVARCATASDGGAATAITYAPTPNAWREWASRSSSITEDSQFLIPDQLEVPFVASKDPPYIRPGEAMGVIMTAVTPNRENASSHHTIVDCVWEEFTLP